ncbi:expressed protein [Chlorella variabilis]|uniref:Expressed protein n=1 Tax=Chlorella variabilis TaxID=554065 RepID=E1ZG09_CHLVA|nr:expressed protein [Chlorella variabilis]EFN55381.1 expressed protein [Chlorella variabilis]|eukprot:XP_005847483.1 expressed protein [Chlorella variabilis]
MTMGVGDERRTVQTDTPEVRAALEHLHDPAVHDHLEKHLDAVSAAQGGRWLESSTVEHEGSHGYGSHSHRPQTDSAEVKAALAGRASPEWREADEKLREARATVQGGRWMDEGNMPRNRPTQIDQPEVKAALAAAQDPEAKKEVERKRAARAATQGGRWLD